MTLIFKVHMKEKQGTELFEPPTFVPLPHTIDISFVLLILQEVLTTVPSINAQRIKMPRGGGVCTPSIAALGRQRQADLSSR